ncbi:MAG TPA: hypothetical protein VL326_24380 [Kofleriaceae bacterium]|jgi:hypothetical protein|nr:hypothetical protein [Kofleriaceae bacterium]
MDKSKQTPNDRRGSRTRRNPRDPAAERKEQRRGWNPADDIFGEKIVDKDLDLDRGKYSTPPPRRS